MFFNKLIELKKVNWKQIIINSMKRSQFTEKLLCKIVDYYSNHIEWLLPTNFKFVMWIVTKQPNKQLKVEQV